ncbi:MAG: hypothetical protein ACJ8AW_14020 [Rhodopila sp.]
MNPGRRPPVTILTSGIGLGVYIPALLIQRQLAGGGIDADVEVLEAWFTAKSLEQLVAYREACQRNFALAQIGHRMARSVESDLDRARLDALLDSWAGQGRTNFIIWSGFWLPVLEEYRRRVPHLAVRRDLCRIDADISASFKVHRDLEGDGTVIWLWHGAEKAIRHEIPVLADVPLTFAERPRRLVVHGGGWGLGTYGKMLPMLARAGYGLDIVIHDPTQRQRHGPEDRFYVLNPDWEPWQRDESGRYIFPPVGLVGDDGQMRYSRNDTFHGFHSVIRQAMGIVSKPGGCTLIDSLAAATPVVLLEAYGYAEQANAGIWEELGFGLPFAAWEAAGCSEEALRRAHQALIARGRSRTGYPGSYAARMLAEGAGA